MEKPSVPGAGPRQPAPPGFASWEELFAEQSRLNAAAERIAAVGEREAGFAGIIADPEKHEVQLYWKGMVPAGVQSALTDARTKAPVRVLAAAYDLQQLSTEVDRWMSLGQVSSAAPAADGSGIQLTVADNRKAADLTRPAGTTAQITVEADTTSSNQPGTAQSANVSLSYWRWSDIAPFYAGGKYGPGNCSTGFAVFDVNGKRGMLTAAHCGKAGVPGVGTEIKTYLDGRHMGWFDSELEDRDIAIIHAPSAPRVFTGPWSSNTSVPVVGSWKVWPGNFVCNSGSTTGENCYIKAVAHGVSVTYTNGQYVKHMIRAKSTGCAGFKGDSGGPIIMYNGTGGALAAGVQSGGGGSAWCAGAGITGYDTILFARVTDALLAFNASLYTS
ncbi:S1 family peptidase [Micromonospora chersina]|uniref:S1 family peptidase n=1 Tax=Micromonospora chersina TaxID=47854 RepID=UPI0037232998